MFSFVSTETVSHLILLKILPARLNKSYSFHFTDVEFKV